MIYEIYLAKSRFDIILNLLLKIFFSNIFFSNFYDEILLFVVNDLEVVKNSQPCIQVGQLEHINYGLMVHE